MGCQPHIKLQRGHVTRQPHPLLGLDQLHILYEPQSPHLSYNLDKLQSSGIPQGSRAPLRVAEAIRGWVCEVK